LKTQASALGLGNAFDELKRKIAENNAEIDASISKNEREQTILSRGIEIKQQERDVEKQVIETKKGIAEIAGKLNAIAEEQAALDEQAVKDAKEKVKALESENNKTKELIVVLLDLKKATGQLTPEQEELLKKYQAQVKSQHLVIDKTKEEIPLLVKKAEASALEASAIGQSVRAHQAKSSELERNKVLMDEEIKQTLALQQQQVISEQQKLKSLELDKESLVVGAQTLQSQIAEAEAEGDIAKANELKLKLADNLIAQAEQEIKIAEQKVEVAKEVVEMAEAERAAAIRKAEAYRKQVDEEEKLLKATIALADAEDGRDENERKAIASIQAKIAILKGEALAQDAAAEAAAASIELGNKQVDIALKGVEAAKAAKDAAIANKKATEDAIKAQDDDTKSKDKNTKATDNNTKATDDLTAAKEREAAAIAAAEEKIRKEEEAAKALADAQKAAAEAAQQHAKELYDLQLEAMDAADSLNSLADSLDTELLKARGDDLGVTIKEFGNQLLDIEVLYEKAGESGKQAYSDAMSDAKELHKIKLDALLAEGAITQQQYTDALNQVGAQVNIAKEQAKAEAEKEDLLRAQQAAIEAMTGSAQEMTLAVKDMQKQFGEFAAAIGGATNELKTLLTLSKVAAGDIDVQWSEVNKTISSTKAAASGVSDSLLSISQSANKLNQTDLSTLNNQITKLNESVSGLKNLL